MSHDPSTTDSQAPSDTTGVGGWVAGANADFDNRRDFWSARSFAGVSLDASLRHYFQSYLDQYFNERFMTGMGAEDILDALDAVPRAGRWLDVGAGTSTLLWSIPLKGIESVHCCDLVPEALAVLEDFVRGESIPRCYSDVLAMYGRDKRDLRDRRDRIEEFLIFDAHRPWPPEMKARRYELVTAIGNFGLCSTPEAYAACFRHLLPHLAEGGRVVGTDWIRSADFIAKEGHDNTYLGEDLTRAAAREAGLTVNICRKVAIAGDPHYDALIVWSLGS